MRCYSQYLKIVSGILYGRRHFWSKWEPIDPSGVSSAKEYGPLNPYIQISTPKGVFFVGALRKQYQAVTDYLRKNTSFDLKGTQLHAINSALFQKSASSKKPNKTQ